MADQDDPQGQPRPTKPSAGKRIASSGRCHWCGYQLKGLPFLQGKCPECGKSYSPQTAARLQPWPSALMICLRLGWPIAGLVLAGSLLVVSTRSNDLRIEGTILGYVMVVSVAINSYFQVRSMLRRSLPEGIRTRGAVAIWRRIGTTICVISLLVLVAPVVFFVGCLIILSGM